MVVGDFPALRAFIVMQSRRPASRPTNTATTPIRQSKR
jgi:hypothetical protein